MMKNDQQKTDNHSPCEGDVYLRDGLRVHIRPITPDDESSLLAFFRALSAESRWLRFFAAVKDQSLVREAHNETAIDGLTTFGLVAVAADGKRIVGHALYSKLTDSHAEAAFAVADDYHGRGLGTTLLFWLAQAAAANGIDVFEAEVMSVNHRMLDVFRNSGFAITTQIQQGLVHLEFPITTPDSPDFPPHIPIVPVTATGTCQLPGESPLRSAAP